MNEGKKDIQLEIPVKLWMEMLLSLGLKVLLKERMKEQIDIDWRFQSTNRS